MHTEADATTHTHFHHKLRILIRLIRFSSSFQFSNRRIIKNYYRIRLPRIYEKKKCHLVPEVLFTLQPLFSWKPFEFSSTSQEIYSVAENDDCKRWNGSQFSLFSLNSEITLLDRMRQSIEWLIILIEVPKYKSNLLEISHFAKETKKQSRNE